MSNKLVLVTGGSGYIAGLLIPRLLETGYRVRCMVRDPETIEFQSWIGQVEVISADVTDPISLKPALDQVDTAYYLIHNMSRGEGYQQAELAGAENFAIAASQAGTKHIIYLGGLADPEAKIAPHMRSRIETGHILRRHPVPVTEFRAGVIVGPGSISFEMIRYLCEQFPILIGPAWLKNRTQPISAKNVIDYLIAAFENKKCRGLIFEIGGSDVYTYGETMLIYGKLRHLNRKMLILPMLPTTLMATVVDKLTPVQKDIARPLIEGLNDHSVVNDPLALKIFPEIEPIGYHQAVQDALSQLHPSHLERSWIGNRHKDRFTKSAGFLIDFRQAEIENTKEEIFQQLVQWWPANLQGFQNDEKKNGSLLLLKDNNWDKGLSWLEWDLVPQSSSTTLLRQTGYIAPRGLRGFLAKRRWQTQQKRIFQQVSQILVG